MAEDFHERQERPKQLWVRPLEAKALPALRAATLPPALAAVDPRRFDARVIQWQHQHLGPDTDPLIAIDGEHVRRSGGLAIASAVGQPHQRVHATRTLQKHESEITAVRQLLERTAFPDHLLALDSLHTQHETMHPSLYDHGADYLVPIKGNQPTILATAKTLLPEDLSPSSDVDGRAVPGRRLG